MYKFQIAIKIAKYRFALTLMNKQMDNEKLRVTNKKKQSLLHTLASTARPNNNWELQNKVILNPIFEKYGLIILMPLDYSQPLQNISRL